MTFRKPRRQKRALPPSCSLSLPRRSVRHLALLPVLVLVVLDDGGNRLEPVFVAFLDRLLQVEVLDGDVVGTEFEIATDRFEIRLLQRAAQFLFLAHVTV